MLSMGLKVPIREDIPAATMTAPAFMVPPPLPVPTDGGSCK